VKRFDRVLNHLIKSGANALGGLNACSATSAVAATCGVRPLERLTAVAEVVSPEVNATAGLRFRLATVAKQKRKA